MGEGLDKGTPACQQDTKDARRYFQQLNGGRSQSRCCCCTRPEGGRTQRPQSLTRAAEGATCRAGWAGPSRVPELEPRPNWRWSPFPAAPSQSVKSRCVSGMGDPGISPAQGATNAKVWSQKRARAYVPHMHRYHINRCHPRFFLLGWFVTRCHQDYFFRRLFPPDLEPQRAAPTARSARKTSCRSPPAAQRDNGSGVQAEMGTRPFAPARPADTAVAPAAPLPCAGSHARITPPRSQSSHQILGGAYDITYRPQQRAKARRNTRCTSCAEWRAAARRTQARRDVTASSPCTPSPRHMQTALLRARKRDRPARGALVSGQVIFSTGGPTIPATCGVFPEETSLPLLACGYLHNLYGDCPPPWTPAAQFSDAILLPSSTISSHAHSKHDTY